ncbi:alcohol dehydrogenase catalytic domain-containing protein [Candidatus Parabeggiatoa sp. HSG14]|uniref:MDR/zinc-dependent alcohol dehydrogenase-like family protein n=1 Tax=Candidatus Parabeggiatoa sp. HSG14 TaxID=3055593 RepID=UPI0025A6E947|nr:alcohol dehydrogenase catalytic domain-containing protein [Thiotrichales bacterium HSG14]
MQALWLENNQLTYQDNIPIPKPRQGEALVHVNLAGICATDLELIKGYYPYTGILGHEFVGEIVQAIDAPERVGERVVGEINIACGLCDTCLRGHFTHCERRTVLGIINQAGAFAEYLCLPLKNLISVSESIPDEVAVFTEPLAAALEIQEQITIFPTNRVLVVGAGRLGQLIAQTLVLTGCHLQVVARHEKQRQLLATRQIGWVDENAISQHTFDIVIEATGSVEGFALARQAVRPRGTIVLKSTYKGDISVNFSSLVVDEIRLIGSRCGPFAPALRLLENRLVEPTLLIDYRYPLSEGLQAFGRIEQPGIFKILLFLT